MIVSMTGQLVPIVLEKPFPQAHLLKICLLNCDNSINRILLSWKMKCFWQSKGVWPQDAIHVLSNGQNDRWFINIKSGLPALLSLLNKNSIVQMFINVNISLLCFFGFTSLTNVQSIWIAVLYVYCAICWQPPVAVTIREVVNCSGFKIPLSCAMTQRKVMGFNGR